MTNAPISNAQPAAARLLLTEEHRCTPTPRWVHVLAAATAALTFVLICWGGLVKSLQAGLAVPDWPLSYGQPQMSIALGLFATTVVLFGALLYLRAKALAVLAIGSGCALIGTYFWFGPMPDWHTIANIRAEHGHRLIAGTVGFLTALLAAALWRTDPRPWVRKLGWIALLAVVVQAVLGGITVHTYLPPIVSASHAALAQAFFALVVTLAAATSQSWFEARPLLPQVDRKPLQRLCVLAVAAIFLQIILGTSVRHAPYDPAAGMDNTKFWWHFAGHGAGLLFVAHTVAMMLARVLRRHGDVAVLTHPAALLAAVLGIQVLLGIGSLFVRLNEYGWDTTTWKVAVKTAHVAGGSLVLGAAVLLMLQAYRRVARLDAPAAEKAAERTALLSQGSAG